MHHIKTIIMQRETFITALVSVLFSFLIMSTSLEAQTMHSNQALSAKQQSIVTIAAFTAIGDLSSLKPALNNGLDAGLTVNEIKEILVQMYAYCGFPRSLNAINTFMTVMDERVQLGLKDETGAQAKPMPPELNRDEYGKNVRLQLTGRNAEPPPSGYQVFTPIIDSFLKEHLFADIFYRDILDYQSREIATIGALAAMGNVNPQLHSHLNIGLNTGISEAQMFNLMDVITAQLGLAKGDNARGVLTTVLNSRE